MLHKVSEPERFLKSRGKILKCGNLCLCAVIGSAVIGKIELFYRLKVGIKMSLRFRDRAAALRKYAFLLFDLRC